MDYSNKYVPKSLSEEDKKLQRKQLKKSADDYKKGKYTPRKKLKSFKSKTSNYILEVRKTLGVPMNFEKISKKLSSSKDKQKKLITGMEEICDKGKAAYYSSGSRPNQNPFSWCKSRVASVLVGGPSRKIDKKIVDKYNIPLI
jgi:hypothetical protein|tara:strand:+ start:218 stop:646 length:429 start_codon:yes stop_codon:yes gene_type:complete